MRYCSQMPPKLSGIQPSGPSRLPHKAHGTVPTAGSSKDKFAPATVNRKVDGTFTVVTQ
ncbi:conserved protein of unknown function [Paraburkholderia kururiensis]